MLAPVMSHVNEKEKKNSYKFVKVMKKGKLSGDMVDKYK